MRQRVGNDPVIKKEKVTGMQIDETGKNRPAVRNTGETVQRPGRKSGEKILKESFSDKLKKNMDPAKTAESGKWTECAGIQAKRCEKIQKAKEVKVRRISYSECDKTEINILEGYTLKAKLEPEGGGKSSVYVEMKDDEGTFRAYLFDTAELKKNSSSPMERLAYEVIKQHISRNNTTIDQKKLETVREGEEDHERITDRQL